MKLSNDVPDAPWVGRGPDDQPSSGHGEEAAGECWYCGEAIYDGERHYAIGEDRICRDCDGLHEYMVWHGCFCA